MPTKKSSVDLSSGSVTGSINIKSEPNKGSISVNTSGGTFIGGNVNSAGGDFVGRDLTSRLSEDELSALFSKINSRINTISHLDDLERSDLKYAMNEIEDELLKNGNLANENFLYRRVRSINRLAPEVSELLVTTFSNPANGFSSLFRAIAEKMRQ